MMAIGSGLKVTRKDVLETRITILILREEVRVVCEESVIACGLC